MRKAIRLKVMVQVQGDTAPAADFAKITSQAVRDVFSVGRWRHPGLKFKLVSVVEDTSDDDDADAPPAPPKPAA